HAPLAERGVPVVEYSGWTAIDEAERAAGEKAGRPGIKLCSWDELLAAAERIASGKTSEVAPDRGTSGRHPDADGPGMESLVVECLHCRTTRVARRDRFKHFESPECPECGYLGWTPVLELTEAERREPRERRHAARRLPSVAE